MSNKQNSRHRRARKTRAHIKRLGESRLSVHRSAKHIYAQLIDDRSQRVLASASSLDPKLREQLGNGGNIAAASAVGARIAELARQAGVERAAFDRSGFRYHGRVKALADAAREAGLDI